MAAGAVAGDRLSRSRTHEFVARETIGHASMELRRMVSEHLTTAHPYLAEFPSLLYAHCGMALNLIEASECVYATRPTHRIRRKG